MAEPPEIVCFGFGTLADDQYSLSWFSVRTPTPEDAVQDAFLKLVEARRPPDDPAAWLRRVAVVPARNRFASLTRLAP